MRAVFFVAAILFAVGCNNPAAQDDSPEVAQATSPATAESEALKGADDDMVAPIAVATADQEPPSVGGVEMSPEQLIEQPRMAQFKESVDPDFANPETTEWTKSERGVPDSMTGSYQAVEELYALSSELGLTQALGQDVQEQTYRIMETGKGEALGVIAQWGFMDDAVIGADMLVYLQQENGRWLITKIEERFHCARGVEGGRCL